MTTILISFLANVLLIESNQTKNHYNKPQSYHRAKQFNKKSFMILFWKILLLYLNKYILTIRIRICISIEFMVIFDIHWKKYFTWQQNIILKLEIYHVRVICKNYGVSLWLITFQRHTQLCKKYGSACSLFTCLPWAWWTLRTVTLVRHNAIEICLHLRWSFFFIGNGSNCVTA